MLDQVKSIDKSRLIRRLWKLDKKQLEKVRSTIQELFSE